MSRIVVTGIGIISAIGHTPEENRRALVNGETGIGKAVFLKTKYANVFPFGEVKLSNETLAEQLCTGNEPATRTDLLSFYAAQQAIADAQLSSKELQSASTALIGASTVGGMCLTDQMYADANSKCASNSQYLESYSNSANTNFLQARLKCGGIINTFNTACSSSANAIMYGARLIKNGLATKVIAGGADSLSKYTVNGFNALMILSQQPCRPFDIGRSGLNLGEGAAFIVLEKEEDVVGKTIYAALKGYGNSNDAFHASSISPNGNGPYLSMQRALRSANLNAADIDFINAHGTATENNDETESQAMLRLYGQPPAFASTKSYTGHTLGAAAAIEAVFSILNLVNQEVYPSKNFEVPIEATLLTPVRNYEKVQLKNVMSNSFGFGGNCSSLIFSKI